MRSKNLQSLIATGRFTLPAAILISVCCWTTTFVLSGVPVLRLLPGFVLCGLVGYLLVEMNNAFALIRIRASAQTSLYVLLVSVCPALYSLYSGQGAAACFLLALIFLFRSYRGENTSACLFHAFVFAGTGSLFVPQLMLLMPFLWIGAYNFRSLNAKSWIASIWGWVFPYWFLFSYAYLTNQMELFFNPFKRLAGFSRIGGWDDVSQLVTFAYVVILFVAGAVHAVALGDEDKLSTRSYLSSLVLVGGCSVVLIGLQPALYAQVLPLLWVCTSILGGRLFILARGRLSNIFFVYSVIGAFLLFAFNLWTLL